MYLPLTSDILCALLTYSLLSHSDIKFIRCKNGIYKINSNYIYILKYMHQQIPTCHLLIVSFLVDAPTNC